MKIHRKKSQALTEKEIDAIVCAEADLDRAWGRAEAVDPSLLGAKIIYRQHAIRRMFERHISEADVEIALQNACIIERYLDDVPYPSCLYLGYADSRPIHIVSAENQKQGEQIIITVYEPNSLQWQSDFTTRKKS